MKSRLNLKDSEKVYFHCGEKYREELIPKLEDICITSVTPLRNLGIGKQLGWYRERGC
jgi:hypothetical protein